MTRFGHMMKDGIADFFDTSQIPDDGEYWAALAKRVAVEAEHDSNATAFGWFARSRVGWVAASILLAAALMLSVVPARPSSPTTYRAAWEQALAPADDVGKSVVSSSSPPAIAALLLANQTGGER